MVHTVWIKLEMFHIIVRLKLYFLDENTQMKTVNFVKHHCLKTINFVKHHSKSTLV